MRSFHLLNTNAVDDDELLDWYDENPKGFFLEYARYLAQSTMSEHHRNENLRKAKESMARKAAEAELETNTSGTEAPVVESEPETDADDRIVSKLHDTKEYGGFAAIMAERIRDMRDQGGEPAEDESQADMVETLSEENDTR